ncbi:unnamed protein product [Mytilus coruscus]|uniref:Immunoglobulin-like beta-sandwich domain-containing protein n=1 Tax=Mytilus coruscus TaxID=42192 RepID=A0A6J8ARS7_MYTCO|nr:unnamed protein product [Mytilus coruscus]
MNTVYICMICFLFRLWNCKKFFLQKNTNVEIACPIIATENDYVTWCFKRSTIISVGKDVNPKFKIIYRVTNTSNLQIFNFTYANEGRYTCQGLIGQEIRQDTVYVTVCKSGNKYSDNNGKSLLRATLKLHISPQFSLDNDRGKDKKATIWNYKCLTLNEDQCETSNDKFLVNVEWISREERTFTEKSTGQSQKQVDVYTGDCASLNLKTNSKCNDNIKIYLTNHMSKVLYLKHFNRTTAETFLCHIYKADNLEEITTVTAEHAG